MFSGLCLYNYVKSPPSQGQNTYRDQDEWSRHHKNTIIAYFGPTYLNIRRMRFGLENLGPALAYVELEHGLIIIV